MHFVPSRGPSLIWHLNDSFHNFHFFMDYTQDQTFPIKERGEKIFVQPHSKKFYFKLSYLILFPLFNMPAIIKTPQFALRFIKIRFSESARISSAPPRIYTHTTGMRFSSSFSQTHSKFVRFAHNLYKSACKLRKRS